MAAAFRGVTPPRPRIALQAGRAPSDSHPSGVHCTLPLDHFPGGRPTHPAHDKAAARTIGDPTQEAGLSATYADHLDFDCVIFEGVTKAASNRLPMSIPSQSGLETLGEKKIPYAISCTGLRACGLYSQGMTGEAAVPLPGHGTTNLVPQALERRYGQRILSRLSSTWGTTRVVKGEDLRRLR